MAKLKKKSKRSTKKKKVVRKLTGSPHILMLQKIFNIQCSMPVIDCDRTGEDDEGRFGFVEASTVFKMYNERLMKERLVWTTESVETLVKGEAVVVNACYGLHDLDSGYKWPHPIMGTGKGFNGQWAANTAQTLAKKQAMLMFFNSSWPQPDDLRDEVKKVARETLGGSQDPQKLGSVIEQMGEFFEQAYEKAAKGRKS